MQSLYPGKYHIIIVAQFPTQEESLQGGEAMTPEANDYLNDALDYIQTNSIMRDRIDWPAWRQEVLTLAAQASTPADTYPAITKALALLGDHHSNFRSPANVQMQMNRGDVRSFGLRIIHPEGIVALIYPDSPADQAGIQIGDLVETINGQPIGQFSHWQLRTLLILNDEHHELDLTLRSARREPPEYSVHLQAAPYNIISMPQGKLLAPEWGYLDLPGLTGGDRSQASAYAHTLQQLIREIDSHHPRAWIIDLRRNTGGNMWPMLAGLGPILGEGEWVVFANQLEKEAAFYRNGEVGIAPDHVLVKVEDPYELQHPEPPVAVLTSQLTSSSGEFTALAFRGLARAHSFGEPTQGVPTTNDARWLSDGARIVLTTASSVDRAGRMYNSSLQPDYPVKIDWLQLGTPGDPVLQAVFQMNNASL